MEVAIDYEVLSDGTKVVTDAILFGIALIGVQPAFEGSTFEKFTNTNLLTEVTAMKSEHEQFLADLVSGSILNRVPETKQEQNFATKEEEKVELKQIEEVTEMAQETVEEKSDVSTIVFSLNSKQIMDILDIVLSGIKYTCGDYEYHKYWIRDYDDAYVYAENCESNCTERMPYVLNGTEAIIEIDKAEVVIKGNYVPVTTEVSAVETTEEIMSETLAEEETKEETKEDMSETIDYKAMYEDMSAKCASLQEEMSAKENGILTMNQELLALKEEKEKMSIEFESLKTYKADIEKLANAEVVKDTFSQLINVLSKEDIDEWKIKSDKYTDINEFSKEIKAFACDKILKTKTNTITQFSRMAIDINGSNEEDSKEDNLWDRLEKRVK